MDSGMARELAGTLAGRFPGSRTPKETLEEWAKALMPLEAEVGYRVIDRLSTQRDTPPNYRSFVRAIMTEKNAGIVQSSDAVSAGITSPCEFCGTAVANGPWAASRYDPMHDRWHNAHTGCADANLHAGVPSTQTRGTQ